MKWRLIGPFRGGRALAVSGVVGHPNTYYFGAVAGGVWKTTDGGATWKPIFDKEPIASIGALAVAPSDPNVIYVGTGEASPRGDMSYGDGVYKSVDGGATWTHVGLRDTRQIGAVIVNPTNPNIVFVAALGHAWGPNPERGIFRSTDGGRTWQKVLYVDGKTGGIDVTFAPSNPHILFAAMWQVIRKPWGFVSGGPGSGLYKSSDGGATWKRLSGHGLPQGVLGRIGVSVAGTDPDRVYALIEAKHGGLFRSDDGGATWTRVSNDHRFRQRAWYFTRVLADPQDPNTVYVLNTSLYRSTDGGKTFKNIHAPHGDNHGIWIDPRNDHRIIESSDGGATISVDDGKTWTTEDNQPTAQFYHVATDNRFHFYVYGAQQDNSTVAIASSTDHGIIGRGDWYHAGGGESGFVLPDPRDPNIIYADAYDGYLTRLNLRTGQEQDISAWPDNPMGHAARHLKYRFQWTAPIAFSPQDPSTLYMGAQVLLKTTDGGMSWTAISPDLTRNDKSKQQSAGGPITKDNTSVEYYDTIFAIAPSPAAAGEIWAGTDDGLVQLTRDGGKTWKNVTPHGCPEWASVDLIDASPSDPATAYVAVDNHGQDDFRPYIFKTHDYGATWTKITDGIADDAYVHAVRVDPARPGLLYAGTERGVYVSFDDGAHWQSLQLNLPPAPVYDLVVKRNDLVVATHGRSFWILDDLSPLRQESAKVADARAYLYRPALAYRLHARGYFLQPGATVGANPPSGAIIYYALKSKPKSPITLKILDAKGNLVRKFSSKPKKKAAMSPAEQEFAAFFAKRNLLPTAPGVNRFVWDLHDKGPARIPGAAGWGFGNLGPFALPGDYQVRLTTDGKTLDEPLVVKEDPRVKTSLADLQKQFDLAMKIRDAVNDADETVNQIRDLRAQLSGLEVRLTGLHRGQAVVAAAKSLDAKAQAIEDKLFQPKSKSSEDALNFPIRLNDKLSNLGSTVESADTAPTAQSYEVFDLLDAQLQAQLSAWKELVSKDLVALDKMALKAKIPVVQPAAPTPQ